MQKDSTNRIKVLYIIGSGRSGSTVVASVLGKDKSIINSGEIYNFKWFFDSAYEFDRKCSCKQLLTDCDYWKAVRRRIGSRTGNDLPDVKIKEQNAFAENNTELFSAICSISEKKIIIDSSKRVYRLSLLNKSPKIEVIVLHLIRDVRAYAHSSRITELKKGASNLIYFRKAFEWVLKNAYVFLTCFYRKNYLFMRYEDFVKDPNTAMSKIYNKLSIKESTIEELSNLEAAKSHQFSGNSGVFDQSSIVLRQDVRYQTQVTSREWLIATIISFPLLILFRYPLTRRAARK